MFIACPRETALAPTENLLRRVIQLLALLFQIAGMITLNTQQRIT